MEELTRISDEIEAFLEKEAEENPDYEFSPENMELWDQAKQKAEKV